MKNARPGNLAVTPQTDTASDERRKDRRCIGQGMVVAINERGLDGSDQAFGVVVDISEGGVRIETMQDIGRTSTACTLSINSGEEILRIPAMLRWATPRRGQPGQVAGFRFIGAFAERAKLRGPSATAEA